MTVTDVPAGTDRFFTDDTFDFEFRDALGATAYGVGDPGMWLATARGIVDGDRQSWFDAWTARADQLSGLGDTAAALGNSRSASWAYLSASAAYSKAMGVVDGLPTDEGNAVLLPTFRNSRRCWDGMIDASAGRFVRVAVPYEGTTLPGYLLRPDTSGARRPTFVMTNGSDGPLASLARRLTAYRVFDWLTRQLDRPTRPDRSLPNHDRGEHDDGRVARSRPASCAFRYGC